MSEIKGTVATKGAVNGTLQTILGKDGLSAYEIAVKNGFEGTEIEWLESLKAETLTLEQIIENVIAQTSKITSVTLYANKWVGEASPYSQRVDILGTTENSKIDLNPTISQLNIFHNKDIAFVVENADGVLTVYCIGQKPTSDYTIQATITEVYVNG